MARLCLISATSARIKGLGAVLLTCAGRFPEPLLVFDNHFLLWVCQGSIKLRILGRVKITAGAP